MLCAFDTYLFAGGKGGEQRGQIVGRSAQYSKEEILLHQDQGPGYKEDVFKRKDFIGKYKGIKEGDFTRRILRYSRTLIVS